MQSEAPAAAEQPLERMLTGDMRPGIQDPAKPYTFTGRVTYATEAEATIVMKSLEVDPELRPEAVTRQLSMEGTSLVLNFAAIDMRTLRAAVGTFCDLLGLATRTLEAFGPGAPGLALRAGETATAKGGGCGSGAKQAVEAQRQQQ